MKRELDGFEINIHGLEDKTCEYHIEVGSSFLKDKDQEIIKSADVVVDVLLTKANGILNLEIEILARLELECDRTLELYEEDFKLNEKHIFKFGEAYEEVTEDLTVLSYGTPKIDLAQLIFDYVFLSIPMKRIHPKYRRQEEFYLEDKSNVDSEENEKIDPRWAALLNLKKND